MSQQKLNVEQAFHQVAERYATTLSAIDDEYLRERATDLRDVAEIEGLARAAAEAVGAINILVNNAVIRHFAPIDKFETANWNTALAVNVSAPFHFIRLLLPGMRAGGYGRIFNFTPANRRSKASRAQRRWSVLTAS